MRDRDSGISLRHLPSTRSAPAWLLLCICALLAAEGCRGVASRQTEREMASDVAWKFIRAIARGDTATAISVSVDSVPVARALRWTGGVDDYWNGVVQFAHPVRIEASHEYDTIYFVTYEVEIAICSPAEQNSSHSLRIVTERRGRRWYVRGWIAPWC